MNQLNFSHSVTLGGDPEFFFTGSKGQTTGAEKILPEGGLIYKPGSAPHDGSYTAISGTTSKVIIDGVQAELNPRPNTCRANLGNEIGACFRDLAKAIKDGKDGINVSFAPLVNITQKELDSLSEKSKVFGCAPSTNIYTAAESKITVDPKKYKKRSAGGHIHLGGRDCYPEVEKALKNIDVMVPILDIIVGNTCVLIDRNPCNKERRKVYGRAGEHRVKPYGVEYRTLSNFWLQSYQLMSFVMGLARMAVHIVQQSTPTNDYVGALNAAVNRDDIIKAINNNDFDLAYSNFLKIEPILLEATGNNNENYPICKTNIDSFHWFIARGFNHFFTEDPFAHWIKLPEGHGTGWETFLNNVVSSDMKKTLSEKIGEFRKSIKKLRESKQEAIGGLKLKLKVLKTFLPEVKKEMPTPVEVAPPVAH